MVDVRLPSMPVDKVESICGFLFGTLSVERDLREGFGSARISSLV